LEFFKKIDYTQLDALVSDKDYIFSEEIKRLLIPNSLEKFFAEAKKISFKENYEQLNDGNIAVQFKNLVGITSKKSYEIQKMIPLVRELCVKYKCKYVIDIVQDW
jgi:hypothetical protein